MDVSRRGFLELTGAGALSALAGPLEQIDAPDDPAEFDAYGVLLGPTAARPGPNSQYLQQFDTYHLLYFDASSGEQSYINHQKASWTELPVPLDKYEDAFGYPVVKNPKNSLDLPSPYHFSEERYRFIENGTRIQDPEANSSRFSGTGKTFTITPQANDTIEFKTAEAPRYIVGHDAAASWAFQFNTTLQGANDRLDLFIEDAYELRFFGDGSGEAATIEGGTDNEVRSFDLTPDLTVPLRPELIFNWYDVGRAQYTVDFTSDDEQLTQILSTITDDEDWIADDPIGRVGFRLDVANSGIELEAASVAYAPQADIAPTGRPKPMAFHHSELNDIPASGWGALGALRIDPDRDNVFTTVNRVSIAGENSVDTEVQLKAVAAADTDADFDDPDGDGTNEGPAVPRHMSPQNSVIQWTPNVSTFPTRTDKVSGNTVPAGRLVGLATEYASGQGSQTQKTNQPFTQKRPVYADDVVLILGHTPDTSTAQPVNMFGATDQDW